jgi:hypothetical protein
MVMADVAIVRMLQGLMESHLHTLQTSEANMFVQGCNGSYGVLKEDTAVTIMMPSIS